MRVHRAFGRQSSKGGLWLMSLEALPETAHATDSKFDLTEHMFAQLSVIAKAIVATMGDAFCEVVLHDFRTPEQSIVGIEGNVTHRTVGGSMSQIGLTMLAEGNEAKDRINYVTRTRTQQVLKSLTVALRDERGDVFGAFCINFDVTSIANLSNNLRTFLDGDKSTVITNVHFGNDTAEVAKVLLEEVIAESEPTGTLTDASRIHDFVALLDRRGYFGVRYSVPLLAEYLGVSRATVYNYLKEVSSRSKRSLETDDVGSSS